MAPSEGVEPWRELMGAFNELYLEHNVVLGDLSEGYTTPEAVDNVSVLFTGEIQCGFPSPALEYIEKGLNLHDYVVKKPAATFFMRAKGDSMTGAGIYPDDLLIIDRSITPTKGNIVAASIHGEMTLKRLGYQLGRPVLLPENSKYKPILITEESEFQIFGVLTFNLHKQI